MKKILLISALSATILSSSASFATTPCDESMPVAGSSAYSASVENKWYLKLNAGAAIFNKQTDKAVNIKMKSNTAFTGEIGAGYYIMDNLRTDLTLGGVVNGNLKKSVTTPSTITTTKSVAAKHKPTITSLLLNGYVDFVDLGMFKVFAGAGVGAAMVKEKIAIKDVSSVLGITTATTTINSSSTVTNFAYQLSLGTSFEVAPGMKAELAYSFRDYGKTKTKKVDGITEGGTRYKSNNVMAGLRFDI